MIGLRPLREDEYADWDHAHRAQYALGLVQHAGLSRDEAEAKVARDIPVVRRDGEAWLYDITIDESERGRGYGRGAMVALEDEARALGHERIALNVWGGNDVARGLYRSLGWAEDSVHMRKRL